MITVMLCTHDVLVCICAYVCMYYWYQCAVLKITYFTCYYVDVHTSECTS